MRLSARFTTLTARLLLASASLTTFGSPRAAHAQPVHIEQVQKVVFDDDLLNADLGGPTDTPIISGHMRPPRAQLIRPRTHFLPELFKSIEHL